MKHSPFGNLPWDMVVFLSITTAGLGVSFKRLAYPERFSAVSSESQTVEREPAANLSARFLVDLGCLDRKAGNERVTFEEKTIRFKGKFCNLSRREMRFFDGVNVKNLTNGSQGTVFFQGLDTSFISDAIGLQRGKNVIQIEWRVAKNGPTRTLITEVYED